MGWQDESTVLTQDWQQGSVALAPIYQGSSQRQGLPTPAQEALGSLETETFPGYHALFGEPSSSTAINALKAVGSAIIPPNVAQAEEMLAGGKVLGKVVELGNKLPILGEPVGALVNRLRGVPSPPTPIVSPGGVQAPRRAAPEVPNIQPPLSILDLARPETTHGGPPPTIIRESQQIVPPHRSLTDATSFQDEWYKGTTGSTVEDIARAEMEARRITHIEGKALNRERLKPLSVHERLAFGDQPVTPATVTPDGSVTPTSLAASVREAVSSAGRKVARTLPQDLAVLKAVPDSPVISEIEKMGVAISDTYYETARDMQALAKIKPADAERVIDTAVNEWIAGGRTPAARDAAIANLPIELQRVMQQRIVNLAAENEVLSRRGLEPVPEHPSPYIPRSVRGRGEERGSMQPQGAGLAEARSSIGPSANERTYDTLAAGRAAGMTYEVPLKGILKRELNGIALRETDALITRLEAQGVIFPTREAAQGASPTGQVYELQGLPFGPKEAVGQGTTGSWWVRTTQEGKFLEDNLRKQSYNQFSEFTGYANQLIRNPSLVVPAVHIVKNMGLKMLAGTSFQDMPKVIGDALKFRYNREALNPTLVQQFEETMAFSKYGKTPEQITQESVPFNPADPGDYVRKPVEKIGLLNSPSSRSVFTRWDPAMRFGRWKDYVDHGMNPQEAANNTWIDLVRYGQRSEWLDAVRSIPMNFFAIWRAGVPQSLYKNMRNAAFTTGAFVGVMDYLREIDLRQTASTTHLYWDYLEKPLASLAKSAEEGKPGEAAAKVGGIGAATGLLGPGGAEFVARNYEALFHVLQGKGDSQELQRMIYLIAQSKGAMAYYKAWEDSGYKDMTQPLNILATATLGRHPAGTMPDRFAKYLPEWMPMMTKSEKYTDLENADARREVQKYRQEIRRNRGQMRRENALQEQIRSVP